MRPPRRHGRSATLAGTLTAAFLAVAVPFIGGWEGRALRAYQDIVGVWTICQGITEGVQPGDTYTAAECDAMFEREILEYHRALTRCIPDLPSMPVGVQVAVTSHGYNVGPAATCGSTMARMLNAGDLVGACNQLPRWNKARVGPRGELREVRGLTNRRIAERDMCLAAARA